MRSHLGAGVLVVAFSNLAASLVSADTVSVPASTSAGASSPVLAAGRLYTFEVSGTYDKWTSGFNSGADAEWVQDPAGNWVEDYGQGQASVPPYPSNWADLLVNGQAVDWMGTKDGSTFAPHVYSDSHVYRYQFLGEGAPVSFRINEIDGTYNRTYYNWYSDNGGALSVSIVETPVPLPPACALGGIGLAVGAVAQWRRRTR